MKLNKIIKIRISSEMDLNINHIAETLGFKKVDLLRLLLSRSLKQLKADAIKVNGIQNLEFSLR
jgi:hypothetical protein